MAKDAGDELNFIYYSDYGYDVYINTIFVKEEFLQANADLASRLIRATMRGYQYAIEHPEETAGFALKYDSSLDLDYQQNVMKAQIPFINTGDAPIGSMNADVWATTQQILLDFNLISKPIDLNTIYTNQYTIQ
jgi:ABC-type nitrate/sulfonate/bicarbonate transport system substrate-binding protein